MTLTVDSWLKTAAPELDSTNLMYWSPATTDDSKIRFMLPAIVYPQGADSTPTDVPTDYVQYLHDSPGFRITDESGTTVGGQPATLLSLISDWGPPEEWFSGSLGCVSKDSKRNDIKSCFAFPPDQQFRLAVIAVRGKTLLAWARTARNSPDAPELYKNFETLLASVRFR